MAISDIRKAAVTMDMATGPAGPAGTVRAAGARPGDGTPAPSDDDDEWR
jgi:hypothetical protein